MSTHTHTTHTVHITLACAAAALLTACAVALPAATHTDITYMSCATVAATGFLPNTHHTACVGADMRMHPINTDCNNDSYNLGGVTAERRLTHPMFTALCN